MDLHFHGAFGVDLMTSPAASLDDLAEELGKAGVAAFCPTTLSSPPGLLKDAVTRLGAWIDQRQSSKRSGSVPLGIHLEGPFISPNACGAHPRGSIRRFDQEELETLWRASRHHLKILTLAPESIRGTSQWNWLQAWARKNKVVLSLGHSRSSRAEAQAAFSKGFSGVTHAWNALSFHHREPGILGAAIGRKGCHLELIIDGIHVCPEIIRWTLDLHRPSPVCMISDCISAGATRPGTFHRFGNLKVRLDKDASRLSDGALAGGGMILTESYRRWVAAESARTGEAPAALLKRTLPHVTTDPLKVLGISSRVLGPRRLRWRVLTDGKLSVNSD